MTLCVTVLAIMVIACTMLGIYDICRDLALDVEYREMWLSFDYWLTQPVEEHFKVPPEMFFFREHPELKWMFPVDNGEVGQFLYLDYDPVVLQDLLDIGEVLSDEGTKPIIINIGSSTYLSEVDMHYRDESFKNRADLTQIAIQ